MAVLTEGDDIFFAGQLANDGDEGATGIVVVDDGLTVVAGPEGFQRDSSLAFPIAYGASHGSTEGRGLPADNLGVGMGDIPYCRVNGVACALVVMMTILR